MKKLIALLLVVVLMLAMAGCSKQDKFLKEYEKLADEFVAAVEDKDTEKAEEIGEKIEQLMEDNKDWLEELDEEKDADFIEKVGEITEEYTKAAMGAAFGSLG